MKSLFLGILLILIIGIGGFAYRAVTESHNAVVACSADARLCPDGTALGRTGAFCTFPACPAPNISINSLGIAFALPAGYTLLPSSDDASVIASYQRAGVASTTEASQIVIRRFAVEASSTPIDVIRATAIQDASGMPAPATAFTSLTIGTHRFTLVTLGRFEGIIDQAYYLTRGNDVLRFDAYDRGVLQWTDPKLNVQTLPGNTDLRALLGTLQGN